MGLNLKRRTKADEWGRIRCRSVIDCHLRSKCRILPGVPVLPRRTGDLSIRGFPSDPMLLVVGCHGCSTRHAARRLILRHTEGEYSVMQAEDGQQPGTISHDGVPLPVVPGVGGVGWRR